jgi:hypothetical protein
MISYRKTYYRTESWIDSFYTKHQIGINELKNAWNNIEYNKDLFIKHFKDPYTCKKEIEEQTDQVFLEKLSSWSAYFEPLVFNEKTALECNLIPFVFKGKNLLASGRYSIDFPCLTEYLDAYQALTDGTIGLESTFYTDRNYFENIVGKGLTEKVLKAITIKRKV